MLQDGYLFKLYYFFCKYTLLMTFDLEPNFGQTSKSKAVNNFFATSSLVMLLRQHNNIKLSPRPL